MKLELTVNGEGHQLEVPPLRRLVDILRVDLGLTGTKEGCGEGECGACTVLMNGDAVDSCLVPACQAQGAKIRTVEGLRREDGTLDPLQQHFVDDGGVQCGFCTPGMLLSARALLDRNPDPTDEEIASAIAGNLCRCTGYTKILDSIRNAAANERSARESVEGRKP